MVTPHEDPESPCHSANPASVMSPGMKEMYDPDRIIEDRVVPYEFDEDDLADLAAYREQGRSSMAHQSWRA